MSGTKIKDALIYVALLPLFIIGLFGALLFLGAGFVITTVEDSLSKWKPKGD